MWRHIEEIKSTEGVDICWIEEAHGLTPKQWQILEPTLRKEGSQFWIIFNPRLATDFVYKNFVTDPPADTIVRKINYTDNPFLSKTILRVIDKAKERDRKEYEHIYLGIPLDDDDRAVIMRSWVNAAIDAHLKIPGAWFGRKILGYDVADDGEDKNATVTMDGSVCVSLDEWKAGQNELVKSTKRARMNALRDKCKVIGYDSIGVGAHTGSTLNEMEWYDHVGFNAGGKVMDPVDLYKDTEVTNADYFANIKAQAWWDLADRFRNTYLAINEGIDVDVSEMISISSAIDDRILNKLADELCTPLRDFDLAGRVKVESKVDIKKRELPSPNIADAMIIANAPTIRNYVPIGSML